MNSRHVEGSFDSLEAARTAVNELKESGFTNDQIHVDESPPPLLELLRLRDDRPKGRATVRVSAPGRMLEAATILRRHDGHDALPVKAESEREVQSLELLEEELVPQPIPVRIGELKVRKEIITEKRTVEVELRREELVVERIRMPMPDGMKGVVLPDDYEPDEHGDLNADEEILRVPLRAERVMLTKRPVVIEEVVFRKRRVPETKTITGEVRREEPILETEGEVRINDAWNEDRAVRASGGGKRGPVRRSS
jgi:uncharacterized protein (TIGR02271 family)